VIDVVESGSGAERLQAAIEFVGSFAPGTEVLLVGSTREAVDDAVRALAARSPATFGLHRFSLTQLAAHVAAADLARRGLAPATSLGSEALAARCAFEALQGSSLTYFSPVSRFPGFARALARTLAELRLSGVAAADVHALGGPAADLADLLARFTAALDSTRTADRAELLRTAARIIRSHPSSFPAALPLLLLDVEILSPAEEDLARALADAAPSGLATVPAGDQLSSEALRRIGARPRKTTAAASDGSSLERLRRYLFSGETAPLAELDGGVRFFSAPGEGREAIEIARYVLDEARVGVRFDEMAVFLRSPEKYSTPLQTAFRRAGIPAYFARGTKRPDPAGRAFLALLACASEGLSAKRFSECLSFGQTPRPDSQGKPARGRVTWSPSDDEMLALRAARQGGEDAGTDETASDPTGSKEEGGPSRATSSDGGESVPAPWRWEELLVEASVIGSHERWQRRLTGLENELRLQLEETASDEPESPHLCRLERQLADIGHLKRFALPVIERLAAFPAAAPWGDWLHELAGLAPMVLRRPERVLRVLAELEPMSAVGPAAVDEVRDVLGERLAFLEEDPPAYRHGRVFVASPEHARGRSFAVVFVPGLAERVFPQRPREDPLLLDAQRLGLGAGLRTQAERGQRERLFLRLAVGAARDRLYLSYPRVDVVEARPRVTSFYGLDVVRATSGRIPDIEDFERRADDEAGARLAWPAPLDPARAIDPVEHDLAVLFHLFHEHSSAARAGRARYLFELNEHLARSLRARYARWERKQWSELDGLVRATEATAAVLAEHRLTVRPYSPSALERFAACPYRFLLSAIHRLEPRQEISPAEQIDPLTRGKLVHRVQAETLRALYDDGLLPIQDATSAPAEAVLMAVLDRVAEEYRDQLAPPILRVWQDEIAAVRADLVTWLHHVARASSAWQPRHFELGFGLPRAAALDPDSVAEPVILPGGVILRGCVDLVERSTRDEALRVTDHKTGADRTRGDLVVGGGETLQPVLYALAVEETLRMPVHEARLFFCTSRGGFADRVVRIDERARAKARQVLEIIDRAVGDGFLPPAPREDACALCDFRLVCGPHEEERLRRKDRARLLDLEELRSLP
jgi:ATP-dependent helicase/nuclease subunit B